MIPLFEGKMVDTLKVALEKVNIFSNNKKHNITINTINNNRQVHLPSKCSQLSGEELEKRIKEETMAAVENALKEKPEKIISLIEEMGLSALSVAASTVAAQNLTLPPAPMTSDDFIEKLSKTVPIISGDVLSDTIVVTEKVDVKIQDGNNKTSEDSDRNKHKGGTDQT